MHKTEICIPTVRNFKLQKKKGSMKKGRHYSCFILFDVEIINRQLIMNQIFYDLATFLQVNTELQDRLATCSSCRTADKSLARPGRKQARKHVSDARDFNKIETRAVIKFFFSARQGAEGNSRHSDRNISFSSFLVGLRTYQHPCIYM